MPERPLIYQGKIVKLGMAAQPFRTLGFQAGPLAFEEPSER